jgi:hypothetical protein
MFVILKNEGTGGLWKFIQGQIGDLKSMVIDTLQSFIIEKVIISGITWILSLLNPASAFVRACKAIIDIIMFFIERASQIAELINAVIEAVTAIASGAIGGAAKAIENALSKSLPVVISFMASLLGIGGISNKVQEVIKRVSQPIEKAIDWVIEQAVKFAKKIGKKLGLGKDKDKNNKDRNNKQEDAQDNIDWWNVKQKLTATDGEQHTLFFSGKDERVTLMIATTPKPYKRFIEDVDVGTLPDGHPKKKAKTEAQPIADEIDNLTSKRKGKGKGVQNREGRAIKEQLIKELNKLAEPTRILADETPIQPPSVVEYGDLTSEGGATWMDAKVLSKNNVKGSTPSDKPLIWEKAQRRKNHDYVRGHLLNENIGGPGTAYNLSPITNDANKQHLKFVEKYVKKAVLDDNKVIRYRVEVKYNKHPSRSSQTAIEERLKNSTSTDPIRDNMKLEIMKYEQEKLPRAFENDWAILKYVGGKWVDDEVQTGVSILSNLPNEEPEI